MASTGATGGAGQAATRVPPAPPARGHLLIAGTGRAGTTLLVRIFTRLGLDTGFTEENIRAVEVNLGRAGLEKNVTRQRAAALPDIVKNPHVVDVLEDGLSNGWFRVDHAILPVRNLFAAAQSRRAVRERAIRAGADPATAPGGLWKTDDPAQQENVLAVQFHRTVELLVAHEVPVTLIGFPRLARDADYFVSVLGGLLDARYGVTPDALRAAHEAEVRRDFIGGHRQ